MQFPGPTNSDVSVPGPKRAIILARTLVPRHTEMSYQHFAIWTLRIITIRDWHLLSLHFSFSLISCCFDRHIYITRWKQGDCDLEGPAKKVAGPENLVRGQGILQFHLLLISTLAPGFRNITATSLITHKRTERSITLCVCLPVWHGGGTKTEIKSYRYKLCKRSSKSGGTQMQRHLQSTALRSHDFTNITTASENICFKSVPNWTELNWASWTS